MQIENLKVGSTIRNYRELCKVLGIDIKTGGAKKNQMEWIGEHISYEKQGHGFIINEILRDEVVPMRDGRAEVIPYMEVLEKLILDLMLQEGNNETLFLSKTQMFRQLCMVNDNYSIGKAQMKELIEGFDVEKETTQDWFSSTDSMLERNIINALDSLQKQSLVHWSRVITVDVDTVVDSAIRESPDIKYDKKGERVSIYDKIDITRHEHRQATDEEVRAILSAERRVLLKLGHRSKSEVVNKGNWGDFTQEVNDLVNEEANINYYYKSYKVIFNDDDIQEQADVLETSLMSWVERNDKQRELNDGLQDRVLSNAEGRQKNTPSHFGQSKTHRQSDRYIPDSNKLSSLLLDLDAENIKQYLKNL